MEVRDVTVRLKGKQLEVGESKIAAIRAAPAVPWSVGTNGGRHVAPELSFNGVKVFSATMFADRHRLGETVTSWIAANGHLSISDVVVTQSSDSQFHCVTISVFYSQL